MASNTGFVRILRPASELLSRIKTSMRDSANDRWSDAEIYNSINRAIDFWNGRVYIPMLYTMTEAFAYDQNEYSLPNYIKPPLVPQRKVERYFWQDFDTSEGEYGWTDIHGWKLYPDGSGGQHLYVEVLEDRFTIDTGRILWWAEQGHVPESAVTLQAGINSTDTSLTIASVLDVGETGFVKINGEVFQYSGIDQDASTTTLTDLLRGIDGTTAATHSTSDPITWMIAYPDMGLVSVLQAQAQAYMQHFYMTDSSARETTHHQWMMRWEQQQVDTFWAGWIPNRPPAMNLSREAFGGFHY